MSISRQSPSFTAPLSPPIMIGGENRSGTTLLSILLDSHPDLVVGPEIDFIEPENLGPHILAVCELMDCGDRRVAGNSKDTIDPEWYDGMHFVIQCERFGLRREDVRALIGGLMAEHDSTLSTLEERCLVIESIGEFRRKNTQKKRWGLKLQRKIKDIETYSRIWPNAHFIQIIRDGRDLAASHLGTVPDWGYRTIADAAHGWLEVVTGPRHGAPPGRYLEIRYEDLVTQPRATLERVLHYLGVAWDEAMLHHSEQAHSLFETPWGHPAAAATRKPLSASRRGRYLQDLTPDQIAAFERIAGKELLNLGYGLSAPEPGRTP
ncbi:sulfotransferase family protein [Xanthomonas sacchari]|uniref:sulfotransferase family protein n=1 Tax=Xanthomonas sacchari TaxID=56458 RepID=UPI0020C46A63|nr:sulfotransferase [Xanthomonas sacchari]